MLEEVKVTTGLATAEVVLGIPWVCLLQSFVDLHGRHQLAFGQQGVDLLHELEGSVLLVEDQSIDVIDHDWDLSPLEEKLQELPVVALLLIVLSVVEAVHLDFTREVAAEDFSYEEAVVEGPRQKSELPNALTSECSSRSTIGQETGAT